MSEHTIITDLARLIRNFDQDAIPAHVTERFKLSLLDAIGCAFQAQSSGVMNGVLAVLPALGTGGDCSVIGTGRRAAVADAVLVNGAAIHALDFNDHLALDPNDGAKLGGHPSDALAVALAVGEWRGNSGKEVLAAAILGYEVFGRFQKLLDRALSWDHVTAYGTVAPAIAGRLMRLDETALAHALAMGTAHGVTPGVVRRGRLSASKFLASAQVMQTATVSTLLAAEGVTGPLAVFEYPEKGLASQVFPGVDMTVLTRPVQGKLMVEGVTIKAYPSLDTSQAAIAAVLEAAKDLSVPASEIERVELRMIDHPGVRQQINDEDRRHPKSRETADHSFYFLAAAALLDGELTPRQFENERWTDPAIIDLMARIAITVDAGLADKAPSGFPAAVTLTARDGRNSEAQIDYAPGHALNPMGQEAVVGKFRRLVDGVVETGHQDAIIEMALGLETLETIDRLMVFIATD